MNPTPNKPPPFKTWKIEIHNFGQNSLENLKKCLDLKPRIQIRMENIFVLFALIFSKINPHLFKKGKPGSLINPHFRTFEKNKF